MLLLALTGCSKNGGTPSQTTTPGEVGPAPETSETATDPNASECVSLVEAEVAQEAYERGMAKLEEARDGEHFVAEPYELAMAALETAAKQGHLQAQKTFGTMNFSSMFMRSAPEPEQEEAYVVSLSFILIAAARGDAEMGEYLPGLGTETKFEEPPLDQVPMEWITEARARADAWMTCHGEAVGDRGAS